MILMFPHSTTSNHGCEAIILSVTDLLSELHVDKTQVELLHRDVQNDDYHTLETNCTILPFFQPKIKRLSWPWLRNTVLNRTTGCAYTSHSHDFKRFMKARPIPAAMLSIGGDNYCYGTPNLLYAIDKWAKKKNVKLIMWGSSIENNCPAEMLRDLSQFDLIITRETLTYEYLKAKLDCKVLCLPDPAFTLKLQEDSAYQLPEDTVGINISPMIMSYETNLNMAFQNYFNLIQYILEKTDHHIALIPHVTSEKTNDVQVLTKLRDAFKGQWDRITLVQESDCRRLKYAISQCRFFVGARTHATIAAYSTLVPTLVVGYSIKARGIAKDLFGQEEHYVLPVQSLERSDQLTNAFKWMEVNEERIRNRLTEIMPEYLAAARSAAKEVLETIEQR